MDNAKVFTSSLAPGFKALSSAPEEVEAKIVAKLGEILHFLSSSVKEGGRRRAVLLWGLKCWLLTGGKHSCLSALPQLLSELIGAGAVEILSHLPLLTSPQTSQQSAGHRDHLSPVEGQRPAGRGHQDLLELLGQGSFQQW